jgi:predicted PurR-regulated permease PerM
MLVHGISGVFCLFTAITVLIAMLTEHMSWVLIFPILFAFLLGFIEIASVRVVQKHGVKVMPRQVIFPIVSLLEK